MEKSLTKFAEFVIEGRRGPLLMTTTFVINRTPTINLLYISCGLICIYYIPYRLEQSPRRLLILGGPKLGS